jgi:hypothetical protein
LLETGIWPPPYIQVDDGDGASDVRDGTGDRTTANDVVRDVLYRLKNVYSNSGDVEYLPSVDRDRYLACSTHRRGGR